MTEIEIIRVLDKMICDGEELLRSDVSSATLVEELDLLKALRAGYCSALDLESEYKIVQKKYKHTTDEVNRLSCELDKLHTELEKVKKTEHYFEVLFSDGSSVRVEDAAHWNINADFTRLKDGNERNVAIFMTADVRGVVERGKRENNED